MLVSLIALVLVFGLYVLARAARHNRTRLVRVYRRRDTYNHDHYVAVPWLGGAGYNHFNALTRPDRIKRLLYVHNPTGEVRSEYGDVSAGWECRALSVSSSDWRDAAGVAFRLWLNGALTGRTLMVYLPGHRRSYRALPRWRVSFTANANLL